MKKCNYWDTGYHHHHSCHISAYDLHIGRPVLSNCSFLVLASPGAQFKSPIHANCQLLFLHHNNRLPCITSSDLSQSGPRLVDPVGTGINIFKLMSEAEKMNRPNCDTGSFACEIYKGLQMFRLLVLMPSCCPHCAKSEEEHQEGLIVVDHQQLAE